MRFRVAVIALIAGLAGCDGLYSPADGGAGGGDGGGSGGSGGGGGSIVDGKDGGAGGGSGGGVAGGSGGGVAGGSGGGVAGGSGGGVAGGSGGGVAGGSGGGVAGGSGGGVAGGSGGSGGSGGGGGSSGGAGGGTVDAGPQAPVTPIPIDWSFRGVYGEYSIGAAATASSILWIRYETGISGKITAIHRTNHTLVGTQQTDLGPYNVVSSGDRVALMGLGSQGQSDWHAQWLDDLGFPIQRSDSLNLVVAGGGVIGSAMFPEPDGGFAVHTVGSKTSGGTHVNGMTKEDGGVTRQETTCGNEIWWDAATLDGTNRRYFIGNVFNNQCDLGGGQYVVPTPLSARQWVVVRYQGANATPGFPLVAQLAAASKSVKGPAALGVNGDSLWVAFPSTTAHLRVERLNPQNLTLMYGDEATGQAYITATASLGIEVNDIVPHPTRDRVYLLVTMYEPKSTWRAEAIGAFNQSTLLLYNFEASTLKLLGVGMLPSTGIGKYGSQMALIDDHLIVTGQCTATPADAGAEPLCSPTPTPAGQDQSFIFSTPAP